MGARAIERFQRPVCYQDLPQDLLPEALERFARVFLGRTADVTPLGVENDRNMWVLILKVFDKFFKLSFRSL